MQSSGHKDKIKQVYFFFINSKSGGGKGRHYLTVPDHRLDYQYSGKLQITIHLIDLFDQEEREHGLAKIKKLMHKIQEKGEKNKEIRVVVCGGDGTVIWVVELIAKHGIDTRNIVFTIIPIGTGNDFSRCLGWGGSPIKFSKSNTAPLKNRIIQWLQAQTSFFDLWTVQLTTFEDGTIFHIRDRTQEDTKQKQLTRGFCNYFGLGIDARIAYSVELRRQKNKFLNLFLYGCIGCCKLFKSIQDTSKAVKQFKIGEGQEEKKEFRMMPEEENQEKVIENEEQQIKEELNQPLLTQPDSSEIRLKEGYRSILALNSVRYMAGLKNVWNTKKLGIKAEHNHPQYTDQRIDDGKIQFLAFKNELRLGLERFINCGARIAQGEGPFTILFNSKEEQTRKEPVFIHIDGEAMKIIHLKSIVIKKNKLVKDGKIKVLLKRSQE